MTKKKLPQKPKLKRLNQKKLKQKMQKPKRKL
jgi:hypothetical protein